MSKLKLGRPPKKIPIKEAADMYNSGMSFEKVAIALTEKYGESITRSTIIRRLKKAGVELTKQRPMTDYERALKFKEKQKAQDLKSD